MKLSTWRPSLVRWLSKYVHIDTWELRTPNEVGEVAAFIPPLGHIKHYNAPTGGRLATATQEIFLSYRYPKTTKYADLPLNIIEGIYSTLSQLVMMDYSGIADLLDVEDYHFLRSENPISVSELGDNYGDWLVTIDFHINIKWIPELEVGFAQPGYYITKAGLRIFEAHLVSDVKTFVPNTLDFQNQISKPSTP